MNMSKLKKIELTEKDNEQSEYRRVEIVAKAVLNSEKALSPAKAISGKRIFELAEKQVKAFDIKYNTFIVSMSGLVKDEFSEINCLGKRQGYYLSSIAKEFGEKSRKDAAEKDTTSETTRKEKEKLLYDVLLNWLLEQGYRSRISAAGRGHGRWGNPDITGIISDEAFGNLAVEIATIEAKISNDGWQQWIFEAVSHRRFSNRSYFAFAHPAELVSKLPQEMRYYSELYNVGILVVGIDNKVFEELNDGKRQSALSDDDVDLIELYSARYNHVQPLYQKEFLESLDIHSSADAFRWGEEIKKRN